MKLICLLLTLMVGWQAKAQFTYVIDQTIPVEQNGTTLSMPWAGGINAAQVNTLDINGDSQPDLVIFDRNANKILTYLRSNNSYSYAPDYEALFPAEVNQWLLIRDFNCDGRKDIFTSDPFGILVFVNITPAGGPLKWRPYNPGFPLLTKGFSSNINLKVNETDVPAIDDVDNDGDLDILNVKFVGAGTVEWHKNLSIERTGRCDSMQLERATQAYGGFEECGCGNFAFGEPCTEPGRTLHAGGKSLLTIDMDNDGDREVLFSEEECARVYLLPNNGTVEAPVMNTALTFPSTTPINFLLFPTPFLEDVDFDNKPDLIASPNLYARTFVNINYGRSLWYYKNTGTSQNPAFTFVQDNFLQDKMLDVGDFSAPAFGDVDGDGDEDLFIGVYAGNTFRGSIFFFENVGTISQPSFRFVTDDFGQLRFGNFYNIKPQVVDMNGDSKADVAFTATELQTGITRLFYMPNRAEKGITGSLLQLVRTEFRIGVNENLTVVDINQDGLPDLLQGSTTGALVYWENVGSPAQLNLVRKNSTYLGVGASTARQNPSTFVSDLDADGRGDLVLCDQQGVLRIYGDFRNFDPTLMQPTTELIYNELTESYSAKRFGQRVKPTVVNLFNSDKPAIVIGSILGGLQVLRNDGGKDLPPEPVIQLFPNPVPKGDDLNIKADRNVLLQVYSVLGQKMSEPLFIPANQVYPLKLNNLAAGLYIARFSSAGKQYAQKFVVQ